MNYPPNFARCSAQHTSGVAIPVSTPAESGRVRGYFSNGYIRRCRTGRYLNRVRPAGACVSGEKPQNAWRGRWRAKFCLARGAWWVVHYAVLGLVANLRSCRRIKEQSQSCPRATRAYGTMQPHSGLLVPLWHLSFMKLSTLYSPITRGLASLRIPDDQFFFAIRVRNCFRLCSAWRRQSNIRP